ncbi:hypothetical protein MBLNU230_g2295t1 [Neophaeotheca triangularis]
MNQRKKHKIKRKYKQRILEHGMGRLKQLMRWRSVRFVTQSSTSKPQIYVQAKITDVWCNFDKKRHNNTKDAEVRSGEEEGVADFTGEEDEEGAKNQMDAAERKPHPHICRGLEKIKHSRSHARSQVSQLEEGYKIRGEAVKGIGKEVSDSTASVAGFDEAKTQGRGDQDPLLDYSSGGVGRAKRRRFA